jgi:hypothetical protein
MTYARQCKTCKKSFTGNAYNDDLCAHCAGLFPKLNYYDLKGEKIN